MYILGDNIIMNTDHFLAFKAETFNEISAIVAFKTVNQRADLYRCNSHEEACKALLGLFAAMKRGDQFIDMNNLSGETER